MKKTIATATALALAAAAGLATPAIAQGNSAQNKAIVDGCKAGSAATGAYSVGECVRFFHTDDPVSFCNVLKTFDLLDTFGYKNVGQCIKANK